MLEAADIYVLALGTVLLLWFSRRSLLHVQTHGFYRFFAFEGILLLLVTNFWHWVDNPFSLPQIASWILLFASAFLAIHAFWLFHAVGIPSSQPRPGPDCSFEQTTHLVTIGAYRFIRHPMYGSLLCLAWGICLKNITSRTILVSVFVSLSLYFTAQVEEKENLRRFGEPYLSYMKKTKRFIPFLW